MLTPKRNIHVKKNLLWLFRPKLIIRVYQFLFTGGLLCMLHFREKPQIRLPSLLHYRPAIWSNPYKGVPGIIFWPMKGWDLPQSNRTAQLYSPICIFTDQSEWLQNSKWGYKILNNQDSDMQTNQTVQIWIIYLLKNGLIGDQLLSLHNQTSHWSWRSALSGSTWDCISPVCKLFTWKKPLFTALQNGNSCWHWIGGSNLLLTVEWINELWYSKMHIRIRSRYVEERGREFFLKGTTKTTITTTTNSFNLSRGDSW